MVVGMAFTLSRVRALGRISASPGGRTAAGKRLAKAWDALAVASSNLREAGVDYPAIAAAADAVAKRVDSCGALLERLAKGA